MRSNTRLLAVGRRAYSSGNLHRAEGACRELLRRQPGEPDALRLLGLVLTDSGQPDAAAQLLANAIQLLGPRPPLCIGLGCVLRGQGDLAAADACFRQALRVDPSSAEAYYHLGGNLMLESRVEDAAAAFAAALQLKPDYAEACGRLANILQILGRFDDAVTGYDKALALKTGDPDCLLQKARLFQQMGRLEEANAAYRAALVPWRRSPDVHCECGVNFAGLGRYREARACYESALALDPEHIFANWNLGLLDLRLGDFLPGWRRYEWRFRPAELSSRYSGRPVWDGRPLHGRPILLHTEQGLGDTIQFIRYAPLVEQRGGSVIVECRPELLRLLQRARGIHQLVAMGETLPDFDCHAPVMSLPGIFGATLDNIPAAVPYLSPIPEAVRHWRSAMDAPAGKLKIGVAWAGSPGHANDRERSLRLEEIQSLRDIPGTAWFNLQKGAEGSGFIDLERFPDDLVETAAVMANLDLVISADTAVAHLAGATARPVWTLLPFAPDWRWMLDRADSPWYPTMRLFRQPRRRDWRSVLARIQEELRVAAP